MSSSGRFLGRLERRFIFRPSILDASHHADGGDSPAPSPGTTIRPIHRHSDSGPRGVHGSNVSVHNRPSDIDGPRCHGVSKGRRCVSAKVGRITKAVGGQAAAKATAVEAKVPEAVWGKTKAAETGAAETDATKAGAAQPQALSFSGLCHHNAAKEQSKSQDPPLHREFSKRTGRVENGPHPQDTKFQQKRSFVAGGFWVAARKPHNLNPLAILTVAIFESNRIGAHVSGDQPLPLPQVRT